MSNFRLTEEAARELISHTSLKIKMFVHNHPDEAEKSIACWLKQNNVTIHHITQSQSEKGGSFVFILCVFYQENN